MQRNLYHCIQPVFAGAHDVVTPEYLLNPRQERATFQN